MSDISLMEFVAQTQRGLYGKIFGADFLKKQTYLTVSSSTFAQTYGRKIWDALNNRTVVYNAIKKVPWGTTAGWVLRTDRGSGRMRPVTETGTLPTVDVSNYVGVYELPKIVAATFGVPIKSIVVNQLEGGMGDILAAELQATERDFIKGINQMLMAGGAYLVSSGGQTTHVVPASIGGHYKVGDRVGYQDATGTENDAGETITVSSVSGGTVTVASHSTATADGDCAFIKSRAGLTSLDDICHADAVAVGGVTMTGSGIDVYNQTTRTAGSYNAAASASYNSGVSRDTSLELIDNAIEAVRINGGEPKLMVSGWDQYFNVERLLNAQQRYMGQEVFQVGVGDEKTLPGTRTGLVLATYKGIPFLPDPDAPHSVATNDTVLGSNIYLLDTDYLEIAVAMPTQYLENRDFFSATALVVRGLIYMMAELRATRIDVHAKICDLAG